MAELSSSDLRISSKNILGQLEDLHRNSMRHGFYHCHVFSHAFCSFAVQDRHFCKVPQRCGASTTVPSLLQLSYPMLRRLRMPSFEVSWYAHFNIAGGSCYRARSYTGTFWRTNVGQALMAASFIAQVLR